MVGLLLVRESSSIAAPQLQIPWALLAEGIAQFAVIERGSPAAACQGTSLRQSRHPPPVALCGGLGRLRGS